MSTSAGSPASSAKDVNARICGADDIVLDRRPRSELPGGALLLALTGVTSAGAVLAVLLALATRR